ncbi:unnamed protein product [Cunninghamella blakesleeana]
MSSESSTANIVAIFKVRFHVHCGNELVWQYPQDINLEGVEYQVICSGLHLVDKDIIYFARNNGFGLGVYRKFEIESDRGASMQAIGIIAPSMESLQQHIPFLKKQIENYSEDDEQNNDILLSYYEKCNQNSQQINSTPSLSINQTYLETFDSVEKALSSYTESKLHQMIHASSLHEMVTLLGPSIFILWKSILLRQRILLMNKNPPMEKLCHFVYQLYLMGNSILPINYEGKEFIPKFNISINDITELEESEYGYIACTSDNIFDIKKDLYDTLVKLPTSDRSSFNLEISSLYIKKNKADDDRFKILLQLIKPNAIQQLPLNNNYPHWSSSLRYQITHDWYTSDSILEFTSSLFCCGNKNRKSKYFIDGVDSTKTPLLLNTNIALNENHEEVDTDNQYENNNSNITNITNEEYNKNNVHPSAHIDYNLIRFFHVLSYQLLLQLQLIIDQYELNYELNDMDATDITYISIEEMVQLGLDPWEDRCFLQQIGQLYFNKKIDIKYFFDNDYLPCCHYVNEETSDSPIQL